MRVAVNVFVPSPPLKSGVEWTDIKEETPHKKVCNFMSDKFHLPLYPGCKKVAKIPENPEKL